METTYISINRWIYKENVLYVYNGILFSLKKEGNPTIHNGIEDIKLSEVSQSQEDKYW